MVDFAKLGRRIKARELAEATLELVADSLKDMSQDELDSFWRAIREATPPSPKKRKEIQTVAMTDTECREFSHLKMEFGKHRDRYIQDIPLSYLDWLAGESETFLRKLSRYLKNDKVAQKLQEEIDNE